MLPTAIHKIMITNMIVSTGIEFDPVSEVPIQSSFIFILCRLSQDATQIGKKG